MAKEKQPTWSFDESDQRITIEAESYYIGELRVITMTIKPNVAGFAVRVRGESRWDSGSFIIPGEYPIGEIAEYLAIKLGHRDKTFFSDVLLETEIWDRRGSLANPRTYPKEVFAKIPLRKFMEGSIKSYKNWLQEMVYNHRVFRGISRERIERGMEDGTYPTRLHSIKNWNRFTLEQLTFAIRYKAWNNPNWGMFASQYFEFYRRVLVAHHEAWEEMPAFMAACIKFPKNERSVETFETIYNAGGNLMRTLQFESVRDLNAYRDMLVERARDKDLRPVLKDYTPPPLSLPDGWTWANKQSFWDLGDLYNCCVNNSSYYSNRLQNGAACIAYRPELSRGSDDGGALAFFEFSETLQSWDLREIRGWSNSQVKIAYMEQARRITTDIRDWYRSKKKKPKAPRSEPKRRWNGEDHVA